MRASYRLRADESEVKGRAEALLYEQTVELPPAAVEDPYVRGEVLARLEGIETEGRGSHRIRVAYPDLATALDPAQILNVLFGNSSMHPDLELVDVELSPATSAALGGPRQGSGGLRKLVDVQDRPLTCTALKPMGLPTRELARLCGVFARSRTTTAWRTTARRPSRSACGPATPRPWRPVQPAGGACSMRRT
jgi:ribulose-bisphosphate carboxylase large chain